MQSCLESKLRQLCVAADAVVVCCRVEAQQAHVRTMLAAGRYEEAAESARKLFESCTEAGMQVG